MQYLVSITAAIALAVSANLNASDADTGPSDQHPSDQQAQGIVKEFAATLQGELQSAMQSGGPVAAVDVCKDRAPAIAASLAEQTGWSVGRTSLKPRNAELNAPDPWEQRVLAQFEESHQAGADAASMTYAEVVEEDGVSVYRYMKAIPANQVCLACHGSDIEPGLAEALDAAYPEDQARGYALGDIRGAFTLSKPL
jgi:hypothetical protein